MFSIFAALSTNAANMHITLSDSILTIATAIDTAHTISYDFRHCMANRLFTFSRVTVDSVTVNEATSDNIGPFLISGRGWSGGNHLLPDGKSRSAKTVDVIIKADNTTLTSDTTLQAKRADIIVTNLLFDPLKPTDLFCRETIHYTVCGNSIQVNASHHFLNETPFTIDRYYGMQSMTIGETALRTPNGIYSQWTPIDNVSRFTKASSPRFRQFIEKNAPRVHGSLYDRQRSGQPKTCRQQRRCFYRELMDKILSQTHWKRRSTTWKRNELGRYLHLVCHPRDRQRLRNLLPRLLQRQKMPLRRTSEHLRPDSSDRFLMETSLMQN